MKKVLGLLVFGLALLVACNKEEIPTGINEVTDLYTVPADAVELPAPTVESVWATDRRYFNLSFGNVLTTSIVGFDALLPSGQYVLGEDAIGNAVLAKTKVNGQAAMKGYITINKNGDNYVISADIDGAAYAWKGKLPLKADPTPTQLTVVQQAQSNVANGTKSITMQLATEGISKSYNEQWQEVWSGEGGYLALDLYSEDGYLHDGSYTACAQGGVIEPGQFGIGYDGVLDMGDWGTYPFENWGTCWWTVKNGAATAEKITSGLVSVSREGDEWVIAWGSKYPQEVIFRGAIPALTKPDAPTPGGGFDYSFTEAELQPVTDQAGNVVSGVYKHPITIMDKAGNEKAYLELLIAEGTTNYEGSYPSTSYASQPGQMADGWEFDGTAWGMGLMSGGSYYVNEDGDKVLMYAGQYTVEVKQLAVGAYEFICSAFDYKAAGPDYVPGDNPGGDGDDGSDLQGVVLKLTSGLTYTMEDQTATNTSADGSALSGVTLWRVTVSDDAGKVAAFDLVVSAGSEDLAGSYTVMSYPDAVGKAGNGWGFAAWNYFGGCYYIVDGAYYFIPADATITVSANSDGTLKFRFSGSVQKDDYSDGGQGGLLLNNVAKS